MMANVVKNLVFILIAMNSLTGLSSYDKRWTDSSLLATSTNVDSGSSINTKTKVSGNDQPKTMNSNLVIWPYDGHQVLANHNREKIDSYVTSIGTESSGQYKVNSNTLKFKPIFLINQRLSAKLKPSKVSLNYVAPLSSNSKLPSTLDFGVCDHGKRLVIDQLNKLSNKINDSFQVILAEPQVGPREPMRRSFPMPLPNFKFPFPFNPRELLRRRSAPFPFCPHHPGGGPNCHCQGNNPYLNMPRNMDFPPFHGDNWGPAFLYPPLDMRQHNYPPHPGKYQENCNCNSCMGGVNMPCYSCSCHTRCDSTTSIVTTTSTTTTSLSTVTITSTTTSPATTETTHIESTTTTTIATTTTTTTIATTTTTTTIETTTTRCITITIECYPTTKPCQMHSIFCIMITPCEVATRTCCATTASLGTIKTMESSVTKDNSKVILSDDAMASLKGETHKMPTTSHSSTRLESIISPSGTTIKPYHQTTLPYVATTCIELNKTIIPIEKTIDAHVSTTSIELEETTIIIGKTTVSCVATTCPKRKKTITPIGKTNDSHVATTCSKRKKTITPIEKTIDSCVATTCPEQKKIITPIETTIYSYLETTDTTIEPLELPNESIYTTIDNSGSTIDLSETTIDLSETSIDLSETTINLLETTIDLPKTATRTLKPTADRKIIDYLDATSGPKYVPFENYNRTFTDFKYPTDLNERMLGKTTMKNILIYVQRHSPIPSMRPEPSPPLPPLQVKGTTKIPCLFPPGSHECDKESGCCPWMSYLLWLNSMMDGQSITTERCLTTSSSCGKLELRLLWFLIIGLALAGAT